MPSGIFHIIEEQLARDMHATQANHLEEVPDMREKAQTRVDAAALHQLDAGQLRQQHRHMAP